MSLLASDIILAVPQRLAHSLAAADMTTGFHLLIDKRDQFVRQAEIPSCISHALHLPEPCPAPTGMQDRRFINF
jgi:hypothetical protein